MIYRISTLVDITNTNARRGEDPIAYRQNQNYMSLLQTIGMRTNVEFISLEKENKSLIDMNFGSNFKGEQDVWTFTLLII
jgi:RNase P subunit RPR2